MDFTLYNTYSKKKEVFVPLTKGKVGLYTCGPTVYDHSHIGNFRTFIFEDLLKRWLIHLGYKVNHVMNITDIDDKTIRRACQENVALEVITNRYTSYFMEDLRWLKILPANQYPRATGYIMEMIKIIEALIDGGFAYAEKDGSVYFNIKSFPDYGRLAKLKINYRKQVNKVKDDEYDKEHPQDFALWKSWKKEDGKYFWDSPWGKGRPGWHIECSAMSLDTLGSHFDIHCGGVDNIFPHHENEIAQSVCYTKDSFVSYWLHSEFLLIDGGKMSKSLGNYYTLKDLQKKGFTPESIRYQLLSGHYRNKISFSLSKKFESDKIVQRINRFFALLKSKGAHKSEEEGFPKEYRKFEIAMNDDLNSPKAIAVFFTWMKQSIKKIEDNDLITRDLYEAWNFLNLFNNIFGFNEKISSEYPNRIKKLLEERDSARKKKKWERADLIRIKIANEGWLVEDTEDGQKLKKI